MLNLEHLLQRSWLTSNSELDSLRVQQAAQEYETATFTKESQAVLNLNLKLQTSAVKAQSKTVDLELRRLEATQLQEHMRIVQVSSQRASCVVSDSDVCP